MRVGDRVEIILRLDCAIPGSLAYKEKGHRGRVVGLHHDAKVAEVEFNWPNLAVERWHFNYLRVLSPVDTLAELGE